MNYKIQNNKTGGWWPAKHWQEKEISKRYVSLNGKTLFIPMYTVVNYFRDLFPTFSYQKHEKYDSSLNNLYEKINTFETFLKSHSFSEVVPEPGPANAKSFSDCEDLILDILVCYQEFLIVHDIKVNQDLIRKLHNIYSLLISKNFDYNIITGVYNMIQTYHLVSINLNCGYTVNIVSGKCRLFVSNFINLENTTVTDPISLDKENLDKLKKLHRIE